MEKRGFLIFLLVAIFLLGLFALSKASALSVCDPFGDTSKCTDITVKDQKTSHDIPVKEVTKPVVEPTPAPLITPAPEEKSDKEDSKGNGKAEETKEDTTDKAAENDKESKGVVDKIKEIFDNAIQTIKNGLGLNGPVKVPKESLNGYPNMKYLADSGKDYELVQQDGKFYLKDEDGKEILFDGLGVFQGDTDSSVSITIDKGKGSNENKSPCGESICIIHPQQNDIVPGKSTVVLHIITADKAFCRYSQTAEFDYNSGEEFNKDDLDMTHTKQLGKLAPGSYVFYYSCSDDKGKKSNAMHYFTVGKDEGADEGAAEEISNDEVQTNDTVESSIDETNHSSFIGWEDKVFPEPANNNSSSETEEDTNIIATEPETITNESAVSGAFDDSGAYTAEIGGTDGAFDAEFNFTTDPSTGDEKLSIVIDAPAPIDEVAGIEEGATLDNSGDGALSDLGNSTTSTENTGASDTNPPSGGSSSGGGSSGGSGGSGGGSSGGSSVKSTPVAAVQKNVTVTIRKDGEVLKVIPLTVDVQPQLITGSTVAPLPAAEIKSKNNVWWVLPLILLALLSIWPILLLTKGKKEENHIVKHLKVLIEKSYAALQKGNMTVALHNYKVLKGYLETYREKIPTSDYHRLMSDSSQLYGYISSRHRMPHAA